jgi:ectoine hydroxylase-related dioxygenase (phytanoyl-CoA dioxygenase family)
MKLDAESVRKYHEQGFLSPLPGLRGDEVRRYLQEFEDFKGRHGGALRQEQLKYLHLCFPWAFELAVHPTVLDAVESLLGPDLLVHGSSVFYKAPDGRDFVAWHQDGYFLGLNPPKYATAWIALTESVAANGCLRVIPGSHTSRLAHEEYRLEGNQLSLSIVDIVDESAAVDVTLSPGEFSLHHVDLVHSSTRNCSGGERIGFAVRYVAAEVTQELVHPPVILAKGKDDRRHFVHATPPAHTSFAECANLQARVHAEYMRRRNAQLAHRTETLR